MARRSDSSQLARGPSCSYHGKSDHGRSSGKREEGMPRSSAALSTFSCSSSTVRACSRLIRASCRSFSRTRSRYGST